jgi:hypothetical protein
VDSKSSKNQYHQNVRFLIIIASFNQQILCKCLIEVVMTKLIFPFLLGLLILSACVSGSGRPPEESLISPITTAEVETTLPPSPTLLPAEKPPSGASQQFRTDFSIHSVPYDDILSGGPPKDGIPAVDNPKYVSIEEADEWIRAVEPVLFVEIEGAARAYPLQILTWHEIVNDVLNDVPIIVSFCPLCNTAIVFERTLEGINYDFGTTGRLRYSNLIMYDRQTESWWQQATGEAIVGELTGAQLNFLPASIISWKDFKTQYPNGDVLSRDTGFQKDYGVNPYSGYDDINRPPFLYAGPETPDTLPPVARVIAAELNGEAVAYPYTILKEEVIINDTLGDTPVLAIWTAGTASALDTSYIRDGRDVGSALLFNREVEGQTLTFHLNDGVVQDKETESTWNFFGEAINGPLVGSQLAPVISTNHFWFSWAAFKPETRIYQP